MRASYNKIGGPDGLLANMKSFDGHSMAGYSTLEDKNARWVTFGRMPTYWRNLFQEYADQGFEYIVYSYGTPIALVLSDGRVIIPDIHYSRTTTRHQGLCRAWLKVKEFAK